MKPDLNLLPLFLAVAEEDNFRAAADRLGVTRSAVSQGVRRLEETFCTRLVTRTTRAVTLTEAGERLREALSRPMSEIAEAMERGAGEEAPRGRLKIAVTSIAERFLSGPLAASFVDACPQVTLDVTVTDEEFDIVAEGFDAGVRLGEVIEQDMVAVPLTDEQREMVVAAPEYLERYGRPERPGDLLNHRCIGWRPQPRVAPYRWEFEENGKAFSIAVEPQITSNDLRFLLRSALTGAGLTFAIKETFRPHIARGELVSLLEAYLPPFRASTSTFRGGPTPLRSCGRWSTMSVNCGVRVSLRECRRTLGCRSDRGRRPRHRLAGGAPRVSSPVRGRRRPGRPDIAACPSHRWRPAGSLRPRRSRA